MEGLGFARRFAHAQAQFRGKAGREDLPRAVGDGVQQRVLPQREAALGRRHSRAARRLSVCFVQRGHPLRVKFMGQGQNEQFRRIDGVRRARQQLGAQALRQLAEQKRCVAQSRSRPASVVMSTVSTRVRPPGLQARAATSGRASTASRNSCTLAVARARSRASPRTQSSRWISQRWRWGRSACGSSSASRRARSVGAAQCSTLPFMGSPGAGVNRLQHEKGNGRGERFAVFGHAVERAVHGAAGRAQAAPAGVLEGLTRLEQGLLPHHAQAFDLFGVAAGVTDDPVARDQLGGGVARVGDGDGVGEADTSVLAPIARAGTRAELPPQTGTWAWAEW
jgi:hypothetical protein